ncbi:MAG: AfsR/SARP family transcriptional regulator, partial [Anaerolineales bacterium]
MGSAGRVRIDLLGGFRVTVGNQAIDDTAWKLRKARALVKILALAPGHRMHQEQILNHLWPDLLPHAAINNLHQTLHAARRALGAGHTSDHPGVNILLKEH